MGVCYWNKQKNPLNNQNIWITKLKVYVFLTFFDIYFYFLWISPCAPILMLKVHWKKSYPLRFSLCFAEACTVFRVPFGYLLNKDENLNLKFLMIISISLANPFFFFTLLLISRENAAPYKSPPPTACFILLALVTSACLPNLILC